ncbi:unnamed protein product [Heligmosomoides polygyrus]|uniref:DUF4537 domain-containing protein n=1 Tax=Heligmosomoides polygyrus TaxID=6339 RepID=A0A183FVY3_HELPZ|nr:unnamed protein product [Heligmosomoides polygyrus]
MSHKIGEITGYKLRPENSGKFPNAFYVPGNSVDEQNTSPNVPDDSVDELNTSTTVHGEPRIRGRSMPVAVDFDRLIGEPRRVPGIGWAVPCDVVGLDSKKAKKSVKHSEWTRHVVKAADPRVCHLDRVAHFMVMRRPVLSVTHKSLELIWSLHSEPQAAGCAKMEKALSEVRCSLHNHSIATGMVADVKQTNGEHPGQEAEVRFEKSGLVRPLLRLSLPKDPSYLQTGAIRGCWKLANNDGCLCISLPRSSVQAENMPPILPTVADVQLVVLEHQRPHLIVSSRPDNGYQRSVLVFGPQWRRVAASGAMRWTL